MLSKKSSTIVFWEEQIITFIILLGSLAFFKCEVPKKTHEENITAGVIRGKHLWENNSVWDAILLWEKVADIMLNLPK